MWLHVYMHILLAHLWTYNLESICTGCAMLHEKKKKTFLPNNIIQICVKIYFA